MLGLALAPGIPAFAAESKLGELRSTVEQWVQTRQLISKTKADWDTEREVLLQTRALFERELKSVEDQMSRITSTNSVAETERAEAEAELSGLTHGLSRATAMVAELEAEARNLVPLLPPPLMTTVQPILNRFPTNSTTTRASAIDRLQNVVSLLNEIDKFNNAVTVVNEKQPDAKGQLVSVDTLYLGLGAAWYVDASGEVAGVGAPGEGGWRWTLKPEVASRVRDAIAMYHSQKTARFVGLPVAVQ